MQSDADSAPAGTRSSWRRRIDLSAPKVTMDELWEIRDFTVHQPSRAAPLTGTIATSAALAEVVVTVWPTTATTITVLRDIAREAVMRMWPSLDAEDITWIWSRSERPRRKGHYATSYSAFGRVVF